MEPKVHYHVHISPPLVIILRQSTPSHLLFKIHFHIVFPSMPMSLTRPSHLFKIQKLLICYYIQT
jgi:hypothetical protein